MQASTIKVKALVRDIRSRWRRRALMQGAALSLLTFLFFSTLLLLLYTTVAVSPLYFIIGMSVAALIVLGVIVQYVIRPGFLKISDQQIALYVEEKIPDLEDRLNSAVEVDDASVQAEHGALIDKLIDDAASRARGIPITTVVDRKRERFLSFSAAAFLLVFLLFGYNSLDDIRLAGGLNLASMAAPAQPFMTVSPGNVEIEKGESQEIIVALRDETDEEMTLVYQEGDGSWEKVTMQKGLGEPTFLFEFFNVQEPVQYYVEFEEIRSDPYTISLYEFPSVAQIDLTYTLPDYTGLAPRTEEDTGDIRGLRGSTVTINIETTGTVEEATMVIDETKTVTLRSLGDGRFRGNLALEDPGFYYIQLTDAADKNNKFPEEYQIFPIEDDKPYITITDPQQDVRVNAIEEVLIATTVQDDYGIKNVRLRYSVNGEEEQTIALMDQEATRPTEVDGEHLFFLEDFSLQPGDVISYYVEAEDYFHTEAPEVTDMYFVEVIPFDQRYSQVNNAGGMQGGQQSALVINQQEIIGATWNLQRKRSEMSGEEYDADRRALVQAQMNLKTSIEERINSTAFSVELQMDETSRKIVDYLRDATQEMGKAMVEIDADDLKKSLTPQRKALVHLLRADALNKEQQVAMNRGQQQGGGSSSATEERMTELMDLELDISKDKYETQPQRSQQQQREQQVDDALRKIKELARKQQNLANQSQNEEMQGEDKKRFIDQLKREQDQLRQETERLANNMRQQSRDGNQMSREMEQRLDRVSENMREAERSLRRGDVDRAMTRQQQALNELQELQRELQMESTDNARDMLENLADNFEQFREQEQQLGKDIEEAASEERVRLGSVSDEELDRLQEKRRNMRDNLEQLTEQAEAIEESVRDDDPELASAIRNALQQMKRDDLEGKMEASERALNQGWLDYAERMEDEIQAAIERLETQRRAFESSLPQTEEEQLARALEDVRDLMQQMQEMQNQAQNQQGQPSPNGNQQNPEAQGQNPNGQGQQGDRQARADQARMQRQLERAQENLDRLQQQLGGNPQAQRQLEQMQNRLVDADHTGVLLEGEAAVEFFKHKVFDPLSQLEMDLARQLDEIEMKNKLYGGRRADVPAEYRDLVEKYYESLAKTQEN